MPQTVKDVMGAVKVRLSPEATLRASRVELSGARTGLAIVDVEGGGVISERDVLRAIAAGTDLDTGDGGRSHDAEPGVGARRDTPCQRRAT